MDDFIIFIVLAIIIYVIFPIVLVKLPGIKIFLPRLFLMFIVLLVGIIFQTLITPQISYPVTNIDFTEVELNRDMVEVSRSVDPLMDIRNLIFPLGALISIFIIYRGTAFRISEP